MQQPKVLSLDIMGGELRGCSLVWWFVRCFFAAPLEAPLGSRRFANGAEEGRSGCNRIRISTREGIPSTPSRSFVFQVVMLDGLWYSPARVHHSPCVVPPSTGFRRHCGVRLADLTAPLVSATKAQRYAVDLLCVLYFLCCVPTSSLW
jgi:hypothetical protein